MTTKGIWYPDKSKATEKDPPLYLHISATTQEILDSAIKKVEELINSELALTEGGRRREEERPRERVWRKIRSGIDKPLLTIYRLI